METYLTFPELARQLGTRPDHLMPYVNRELDPLPLRFIKGKRRSGFVVVEEMNEWIERNTVHYQEKENYVGRKRGGSAQATKLRAPQNQG